MRELWDASGTLAGERIRYLDRNAIAELLRNGPVEFVVADCGAHLKWIPTDERFAFWKTVRAQVSDPGQQIFLDQFPDGVAYTASQWQGRSSRCVVLLEKHH